MSLPNNRCRVVLLVEDLRLTTWGYPVIPLFTWFYNVLYISVGARFLKHQQYETIQAHDLHLQADNVETRDNGSIIMSISQVLEPPKLDS